MHVPILTQLLFKKIATENGDFKNFLNIEIGISTPCRHCSDFQV